jgi:hypothetical protein
MAASADCLAPAPPQEIKPATDFDIGDVPADDARLLKSVLTVASALRHPAAFISHYNCIPQDQHHLVQLRIVPGTSVGIQDMLTIQNINSVRIDDIFVSTQSTAEGKTALSLNIQCIRSTADIPVLHDRVIQVRVTETARRTKRKLQ